MQVFEVGRCWSSAGLRVILGAGWYVSGFAGITGEDVQK